jgi:hypothetical protein
VAAGGVQSSHAGRVFERAFLTARCVCACLCLCVCVRARVQFHPRFYVSIFNELGVTTVVRLNEPMYERCVTLAPRTAPGAPHTSGAYTASPSPCASGSYSPCTCGH